MESAKSNGSLRSRKCKSSRVHFSPELWTVLILACVITLELTAYIPVETLQSSLNDDSGLGTISLACLYGPYFVFAIVAPAIVRVLTPKWTIFCAWCSDLFYLGANFYPTWYTLIPACVLTGSITGPLWTAKDLYISEMAKQSAKKSIQNENQFPQVYQSKLSFYNGIVFGGISFGGLLGQFISSLVLSQGSNSETFGELCGPFHCANKDLPLALNLTNATVHGVVKPDRSLIYTLLGILTSLVGLAMTLTAVGLRQISFEKVNQSVKSTVLSCSSRLADCRILLMIPQILFFGFSHGIISSDYTRSYVTCGKGVAMLGYIFISKDICSTIASIACGRLVKYTGRQVQVVLAFAGYVGFYSMMWFWTPSSDDHMTVYFVSPAIFGISDVVFQTHICTILAVMFENDKAAAFANFYTFRALSKSLSFGLSAFVCVWVKLTLVSVFLVLAFVSFVILETCVINRKPKTPKDEMAIEVMLPNSGVET